MKDNNLFYCNLYKKKYKDMKEYANINCKGKRCRNCKYSDRIFTNVK